MSTDVKRDQSLAMVDTHEAQILAHWTYGDGVALCGKRLMGLPAPPGLDQCIVCVDLVRSA